MQIIKKTDDNSASSFYLLTDAEQHAELAGRTTGDASVKEYLIVVHGTFTLKHAHVPSEAALPKGENLVITLDADNHAVNGLGVASNSSVESPLLNEASAYVFA